MFNLNSPKNKRILAVFVSILVISSLILIILGSKKSSEENVLGIETNDNVSPIVTGPTSLVKSEMYDVVGNATITVTPTQSSTGQSNNSNDNPTNTPTLTPTSLVSRKTEQFKIAKNGFALEATSQDQLEGITFKMLFKDGTESNIYKINIEEQDTDKDGNPVGTFRSQLYLFSQGIMQIDFYYSSTTEKNFTVNALDFETSTKLKSYNTASTSSNGDSEYKKNFLKAAGLNIVTRSEWGGPEENIFEPGWTPGYYAVNRIVIHHTDTDIDLANPANTVKAIWRYHTYNNDWGDIGYNYLIDQNGVIYEGRAGTNGVKSNHAPPNEGSIGIAMLGTYTDQLPTQAALDTLTKLVSYLSVVDNIPLTYKTTFNLSDPAGIYPHRAIVATSCPGNAFAAILPNIVSAASNMSGDFAQFKDLNSKISNEIVNNKIVQTDENAEVIIKTSDLSSGIKAKLNDLSPRLVKSVSIDGNIVYRVKKELLEQFLVELSIVAPEAKPQPNYLYESTGWTEDTLASPDRSIPDDFDITSHWNLNKIKAPEGWNALYNSPAGVHTGTDNVIVAVLDTGVAYENYSFVDPGTNTDNDTYAIYSADLGKFIVLPNFTGVSISPETDNIADMGLERNFFKSPEFSSSTFINGYDVGMKYICDWRAADGTKPCNSIELEKINHGNDDEGHGTFVATIIAGTTGIAPGYTKTDNIIGIASGVKIMPVKINFPNDQSLGDVLQDKITSLTLSMGINKAIQGNANIINLSLSATCGATCSGYSDPLVESAINNAYNNHNILIIAASGNTGTNSVLFPAILPNVLSVGATNSSDTRANYSNYGTDLDMVAPVGNSTGGSTIKSSSYTCLTTDECEFERNLNGFPDRFAGINATGTSFAAPQVAAAAALIKSNKAELTNSEIKDRLIYYATDLGTAGWDEQTGYGNLNIYNSLANEIIPNITTISPTYGTVTGGTRVKINGTGLQVGVKIFFGNTEASKVEFVDENKVIATAPAESANLVSIKARNPNGSENVLPSSYTYKVLTFGTETWFRSGIKNWNTNQTKGTINGDFNNDGYSDIALIYDYGNNDMGIWVTLSNGTTFNNAQLWYRTGAGNWNVNQTKGFLGGDFNNDGYSDIALIYDYGNNDMGIWVMLSNGTNINNTRLWYRTGLGNWNVNQTKEYLSGDFNNDGFGDVGLVYDYGNDDMGIWVMPSNGNLISNSRLWFRSGVHNWNINQTKGFVSGDFNNDGLSDFGFVYNYGNNDMGIWIMPSNGSSISSPGLWYRTGAGNWNIYQTKGVMCGDFNGDGNSDIGLAYDYGNEDMGIWIMPSNGRIISNPSLWFRSGTHNWNSNNTKFWNNGDFNNNQLSEISAIYDYGNNDMGIWIFKIIN